MSTINENTPLGDLVDAYPLMSKVLLKYGLDFCCGGRKSLAEACKASDIDLEVVLQELAPSLLTPEDKQWSTAATPDLIAHILEAHHVPMPGLLSHIEELAVRVFKRHGDKDPARLASLKNTVLALSSELTDHMAKEENILFPWILGGREPRPVGPIQCMQAEHEHAGDLLDKLATLTDGFQPPDGACRSWRTLYAQLQHLDQDLRTHIHLENNILFPRAI